MKKSIYYLESYQPKLSENISENEEELIKFIRSNSVLSEEDKATL